MSLNDLLPILQVSIGPVILISGVGLLLLTMTNRFGRIIDRSRQFCDQLLAGNDSDQHKKNIESQLKVLLRRANIVRAAIALAGLSALLAALLIIVLFLNSLLQLGFIFLISILFSICMLCLIGSLIFFIADINISLTVIKLEAAELDSVTV
ncbi:MAG: DUF2721 domain-containing protein [Sulfuriflexus sp.]|nr:DUF2721 domain-containing protein [Sulfuriflexus sp.]